MPTIPLTTRQLRSPIGVAIVAGVMLFQGDEGRRREYRSAALKQWSLSKMERHGLGIDVAGARWLATHPTAEDGGAMFREAYKRGAVAGQALVRGLLKAQKAKSHALADMAPIYAVSAKTFQNIDWPEFRPVAHLWAAHLVRMRHGLGGLDCGPCRPDGLAAFLAHAEKILEQASTPARQSRYPIIDAAEAWRVPPDLPLG